MARLVYGALALEAAALVAGFLMRTTRVPLLVSIGCAVVVCALVLGGWSRRLRRGEVDEGEGGKEPEGRFELEELGATDELALTATLDTPPPPAPPSTPPRRKLPSKRKLPAPAPARERPARPPSHARVGTGAQRRPLGSEGGEVVAVVPGASRYHRPGCRFARKDKVRMVDLALARRRGYVACAVCRPPIRP